MSTDRRSHIAFRMPPELHERTRTVIGRIRQDSTPRAHADELAEVIVDLTHTGLSSYFLEPLEQIDAGALALGTARVGVGVAGKGLPTLVRRIVGNMTDEQLGRLVEVMDEMII